MVTTFLTTEELVILTGRHRAAHQVRALREMGIACWVNAAGRPIVPRSAVEGAQGLQVRQEAAWVPRPLRSNC